MMTRVIAVLVALLLTLTGCSLAGSGDAEDTGVVGVDSAADLDRSEPEAEGAADDAGGEAGTDGGSSVDVGLLAPGSVTSEEAPMMVRRVELQVLVDDVAAAATRARATVAGSGGWVESEEVVPRTQDRAGHGSLVLRVPSTALDGTITSLSELGEVTYSRSSTEDVRAEYRDVEARVATLEAGAQRLRELIAEAPSVESIASLERELTAREADLDALKARMKVLEADVSRSTITLHLAEESEDLVPAASQTGFVGGLRQGWEAFTTSVTLVLTAAGALLPFLALVALLGLPLLWWLRRRRAAAGLASQHDRPAAAATDPDGPGSGRP